MPFELLPPPAPPSSPRPRDNLVRPWYAMEIRDAFDGVAQRGILGALDIRGIDSGHVLRHMQVGEAEVLTCGRLLREQGGGGDPLLLAAPDLGPFRRPLRELTSEGRPDLRMDAPDGGELRLWVWGRQRSPEPAALGPLLLADGHHRLEAARRLYRSRPDAAAPRLPALVVDHARHPLRLSALHRVIPGLDLDRALSVVERFARVRPRAEGTPMAPPPRGSFLLTGRGRGWEVSRISAALLASRLRRLPPEWVELDAAVSDHVLIPLVCEDQGLEVGLNYTATHPRPSEVGVVLPAPTWQQVWASAANGTGMPMKSTRLSPRPLPGLLTRLENPVL